MRLLLHTHVLIWLFGTPEKLPDRVSIAITEAETIAVSVVSAWEHGLKRAKRRDETMPSFEQLLTDIDVERLDFPFDCHLFAESLPPIHKDPFDRMLIAQALHHGLTLVTADVTMRDYPVRTLW